MNLGEIHAEFVEIIVRHKMRTQGMDPADAPSHLGPVGAMRENALDIADDLVAAIAAKLGVVLPKVYCFVMAKTGPDVEGVALAEDGVVVGQHISSNEDWMLYDLGRRLYHRKEYAAHYPEGYQLVFAEPPDEVIALSPLVKRP